MFKVICWLQALWQCNVHAFSNISLPSFETVLHNSTISFLNRYYSCANSLVAVHRSQNVIYCWLYQIVSPYTFSVWGCLVFVCFLCFCVIISFLYCMFLSVCLGLSLLLWVSKPEINVLIDWLRYGSITTAARWRHNMALLGACLSQAGLWQRAPTASVLR